MSPSRRDQLRLQVEELEAQRLGNSLVRLGRLTYQRTAERCSRLSELRLSHTVVVATLIAPRGLATNWLSAWG